MTNIVWRSNTLREGQIQIIYQEINASSFIFRIQTLDSSIEPPTLLTQRAQVLLRGFNSQNKRGSNRTRIIRHHHHHLHSHIHSQQRGFLRRICQRERKRETERERQREIYDIHSLRKITAHLCVLHGYLLAPHGSKRSEDKKWEYEGEEKRSRYQDPLRRLSAHSRSHARSISSCLRAPMPQKRR